MTSPLAGAKEARNEIKKFHISLNHEHLVPEQCYRRNHSNFLSRNYEVIPIFVSRTVTELERNTDQPVTENYRKIVHDYLCQMAYFLRNYTNVAPEKLEYHIPEEIRKAGLRKAPEIDHQ